MKKIIALALSLLPSLADAQTYTTMQWGLDKTASPYNFGANISSSWRNLGTVSSAGVWSVNPSFVNVAQSGPDWATYSTQYFPVMANIGSMPLQLWSAASPPADMFREA